MIILPHHVLHSAGQKWNCECVLISQCTCTVCVHSNTPDTPVSMLPPLPGRGSHACEMPAVLHRQHVATLSAMWADGGSAARVKFPLSSDPEASKRRRLWSLSFLALRSVGVLDTLKAVKTHTHTHTRLTLPLFNVLKHNSTARLLVGGSS